MKKRTLALIMAVVLMLSVAVPGTLAVSHAQDGTVATMSASGPEEGKVALSQDKVALVGRGIGKQLSPIVTAYAPKECKETDGGLQWQILLPGTDGVWANIGTPEPWQTELSLQVNYGLVANLLEGEEGAVTLRCRWTPVEGEAIDSDNLTVTYTAAKPGEQPETEANDETAAKAAPAAQTAAQRPARVVRAPGEAEVMPLADEPEQPETEAAPTPASETEATAAPEATETPAPETEATAAPEATATPASTQAANEPMPAAEGDDETPSTSPTAPANYSIIINYVFTDGSQAANPWTGSIGAGMGYHQEVKSPEVVGYTPDQPIVDVNITSAGEDYTYTVTYSPAVVNFKVEHWQQNTDNDQYTLDSTDSKTGYTKSEVGAGLENEYTGFYDLLYDESMPIAADGSTVVKIYYDRYYYLMNFDMDGGYGTDPVYARYNAPIGEVKDPTKAGYTFGGWAETEGGTTAVTLPKTMPAESKTYYAIWTPAATAKVTVVFWGENADDKGYSYLADQTKVINLKPGREFTYTEGEMLVCNKEVHTHTDACLGCGKTEHTHSAVDGSCYTLTCTEAEAHTHGTDCYAGVGNQQRVYTGLPDNPKEGQVYDHWYYGNLIYIKGSWYRYSGSTVSGNVAPTTCGKEESTHIHNNGCYTLTCTTEVHTHNLDCYTTCGKSEHTHNSDCYMQGAGLDSKLWKFVKSDTITVAADGSSVVNVYYDRVEYSVQFYNGSGNSEYTDIKITAKWGAFIGDKWPTKNNSATWAVNPSSNDNNVSGPYQVYLQEMPVGGDKFYGPKTDSGTQSAYYYVEILPGETGTETYNNKSYKLHHTDTSPGSGYVVTDDDKYAIQGFTFVGFTANRTNSSYEERYYYNNAKFYYTRNSYKLTFNNQYSDVKNETVKFEAPLNTYGDYVPEVPSAYEPGSVEFGGWYQNPQCTGEEYKLDEHTMPANDLILYAKWVPVTHNVEVYKTADMKAEDKIGETQVVSHRDVATEPATPTHPSSDKYEFVGWFYLTDDPTPVEKAFDFSMPISRDMKIYAKWSSNVMVDYTIKYVLKDGTEIAPATTGKNLAGTTKTFDAKVGAELNEGYQSGYFPTTNSHNLELNIDGENTYSFVYVPKVKVPYTVKYLEYGTGKVLKEEKHAETRDAVITEKFEFIQDYAPDAYQKRLILSANEEENVIIFWYVADTEHAPVQIIHWTQNISGDSYTEYTSNTIPNGVIGTTYTENPLTIEGFQYRLSAEDSSYVSNPESVLTREGLVLNLYYDRIEYPYEFKFLEQGTDKELTTSTTGNDRYQAQVTEKAKTIPGYKLVSDENQAITIAIEDPANVAKKNVKIFYYQEETIEIKYQVVGPDGCGTLSSYADQNVKVFTGTAQGSTPTAGDGFKFVGWYKDEACTQPVDASWVDETTNKITPQKTDGKNVAATYYAKFEYDITSLTITKAAAVGTTFDAGETFVFTVTNTSTNESIKVVIQGAGSKTITGLKVGETYTVKEDTGWSWRYEPTYKVGESTTSSITLVADAGKNVVTVTNERTNDKWLDGSTAAVNEWKDGKLQRTDSNANN